MTPTNPFLNASRAAFAELTTAEAKAWYRVKFSEFSAFLGNLAHRGISTVTRLVKPHSETTPLVPVAVETTDVDGVSPLPETQETIAAVAPVTEVDSFDELVNNGLENSETSADLDLGFDPSTHEQQETTISQPLETTVEEAEDPETLDTEEVSESEALDDEPTQLSDDEDSDEEDSVEEEDSAKVEAEFFVSRAR